MDGDDVTVLDSEVVADHTVKARAAIIKIVIRQHNEDSVLSLLATDENGVAAEQLKGLHCVI